MSREALREGLRALLALPRPAQVEAARALSRRLAEAAPDEEWNTRFGPGSLFEAWTATALVRGLHGANAALLARVTARPGWRVIEAGGGDGRLWHLVTPAPGELVLVDPSPEAHAQVAAGLPPQVQLTSKVCGVEAAALPEADLFLASLTLHHLAGRDAAERARHGLGGPGKLEVLQAAARALRARGGLLVLNEADVYCDLQLAPGDPLLADHLVDSYLRRCGRALLAEWDALEAAGDPEGLLPRVAAILHRWCLDQIGLAEAPRAARDVYELDVFRWLDLLDAAGLVVLERRFTDDWGLFHRFVCRPRGGEGESFSSPRVSGP